MRAKSKACTHLKIKCSKQGRSVTMTLYYLIRLNSYSTALPLRFHLTAKLSLLPLTYFKLHLSSTYSSVTTTTTTINPNYSLYSKEQTLFSFFKNCSTMKNLKQFHAHIIQTGFEQNLFVTGKIIMFCAVSERGDMDYAVSVFKRIKNPDGFLWNTMIRGFGKTREPETAFEYFKKMQEEGEGADNFTFSFLLKVCGQLGSAALGKQIHCNTVKHGLEGHVFVRNTLIHMYGMFEDINAALYVFEEIPSSDLVAWNTIIDCHVHCGKYKEALDLFSRMLRNNIDPDDATMVVTLSACSALGALDFGRWIHSCINKTTLGNIISVSNSLIDMYSKCGAVEEALKTFKKMNYRNVVSWNTMIIGLAMHGHSDEALRLFSEMVDEKLDIPNDVTFLGVLSACSHNGMVEEGRKYFDSMSKVYHIQPTIKHYGCMVDILGRAGFVGEAYYLIRTMPMECNAIVLRTLLAACRLHGDVELGEKVRKHLLEVEPDHSSDYVLLANMYASVGQWNKVVKVRKLMQNKGVQKPKPGNSFVGVNPSTRLEMESAEIML